MSIFSRSKGVSSAMSSSRCVASVDLADHAAEFREAREMHQRLVVGLQQAGEADAAADFQRMSLTIADRIGQIGFEIALGGVEPGQRLGMRIESGDAAEAAFQHRLVGRVAVDRIGADVDNMSQARGREQGHQGVVS
ncbi:hypothetical protein ONR75_19945 [Rhodopseudomonas sp. P2A-2r]|uniref:hypothetical protein n=1 Tax=Rhodopseudomonas sp. P2A-2r TaxID=2991972 RepID=UPI0022342428|nr:hypothetical protein [Rhodopseudomonas sp. P2A-2r]UZE47235.1 hypothetical protein ONR75_19945 [Rhodopseudomonas sp. P2A-2r]